MCSPPPPPERLPDPDPDATGGEAGDTAACGVAGVAERKEKAACCRGCAAGGVIMLPADVPVAGSGVDSGTAARRLLCCRRGEAALPGSPWPSPAPVSSCVGRLSGGEAQASVMVRVRLRRSSAAAPVACALMALSAGVVGVARVGSADRVGVVCA